MISSSGPLLVFDNGQGSDPTGLPSEMTSLDTYWSKHYRENARDESQTEDLAPWVVKSFQTKIENHANQEKRLRSISIL